MTGSDHRTWRTRALATATAAMVAGVGLGVFESYEAGVDATVEIVREYEPDRSKTDVYDDFFGIYRELREATINSWDKLQAATRRAAAL